MFNKELLLDKRGVFSSRRDDEGRKGSKTVKVFPFPFPEATSQFKTSPYLPHSHFLCPSSSSLHLFLVLSLLCLMDS